MSEMKSMVDINSNMGQLGGIVGVMGNGMLQNTLVIGDLATGNTSNLGRIYGGVTNGSAQITMSNGIAFSGQLYGNTTSSVLSGTNATALVTTEELETEVPYRDQARLGTGFDITGEVGGYPVTSGYMPMLMDSDGGVLADQTPILRKDGRLKITNVNMLPNQQGSYTLSVNAATGDSSFRLKGVECDAFELDGSSGVQDDGTNSIVGQQWKITYSNVTLKQYLSAYAVTVVFENTEGIEQRLSYQLIGNYYRQISNANQWVTVMYQYGQNFEITGNIDLSQVSQDVIVNNNLVNLKINSLRSSSGENYTVKGLHYNAQTQSEAMIASLAGTMENITFEDITISNRSKALGGTNIGLIGQNNGTIQNTVFKNITVDGYSAQNVGCVGQNNGVIDQVTVLDAVITSDQSGAQYVGGLVGYNTGEVTHITAEGMRTGTTYRGHYHGGTTPFMSDYSYTVVGRDYTGGVIGYSTSGYSDIALKAAYVKGTQAVGGISSWLDAVVAENLTVGDPEDKAKAVRVEGSGWYTGGVIGRTASSAGEYVYSTIRNAKLCNAFVIGQGDSGGILGGTGKWYTRIYDSSVVRATIKGASYVGGIVGNYTFNYRNYVEDCRISGTTCIGGIQGQSGAIGEGTRVIGCTIEGSGDSVGGIIGDHGNDSIRSALVADCEIKGNQYVGGAAGNSRNPIYGVSVWNTKVSGQSMVGGLAGRAAAYQYYRCSVDAEVSAELSKAGGAFGEVIGFNSTETAADRQKVTAYNLVIGGTVTAPAMAGGFAGAYSITPALLDMNGNIKASGSSKLISRI